MDIDYFVAIKAVGDWELDVLAIPFGSRDSDGQWFDDRTEIMAEQFQTPLIVYQHGIKDGTVTKDGYAQIDASPVIPGKVVPGSLKKMVDGWHIRVILDKAKEAAKNLMDAARNGMVAVSSGSISHLARLDTGDKVIQYEKNRPGRIATWALAEVSLWVKKDGNAEPANRFAYALPAMKAMYRDAGIAFPDIEKDTSGGADAEEVKRRARVKELQRQSKQLSKVLRNRAEESK